MSTRYAKIFPFRLFRWFFDWLSCLLFCLFLCFFFGWSLQWILVVLNSVHFVNENNSNRNCLQFKQKLFQLLSTVFVCVECMCAFFFQLCNIRSPLVCPPPPLPPCIPRRLSYVCAIVGGDRLLGYCVYYFVHLTSALISALNKNYIVEREWGGGEH